MTVVPLFCARFIKGHAAHDHLLAEGTWPGRASGFPDGSTGNSISAQLNWARLKAGQDHTTASETAACATAALDRL